MKIHDTGVFLLIRELLLTKLRSRPQSLTLNPLGFSLLWFEPRLEHGWSGGFSPGSPVFTHLGWTIGSIQVKYSCITKTRLFKYIENFTTKKREKKSDKKFWYFHISAQNMDCGYSLELPRWGSSNEYPQSMFLSRNKKNNVYPCKPQFYYIKVGFKGVKII